MSEFQRESEAFDNDRPDTSRTAEQYEIVKGVFTSVLKSGYSPNLISIAEGPEMQKLLGLISVYEDPKYDLGLTVAVAKAHLDAKADVRNRPDMYPGPQEQQ